MSQVPALPDQPMSSDLIKEIAMDIGKQVVAYVRVMYPEAVTATSSTFCLALRNTIYNEIMASLSTTDETAIRARLKENAAFRRRWVKAYADIRDRAKQRPPADQPEGRP